MSNIAITAENLSKSYLVGHQREGYTALRDVIAREARNFGRKAVDLVRGRQIVQGHDVEEFWALRDVSFEVKQGEVLGIIGRNGAGKSTLLKILSRITEPHSGRAILRGRVASLLEVGTGFHPELTGRENIFLNGAILGMTRAEIRLKFDEIVAFAEVERFLDTPVKRYSSGMYVRLAFAVAAHLQSEILLIDEVLAVGDLEFQKKCLGKMEDLSRGGRTVLFVSHNLGSIRSLCARGIVLSNGRVVADASVAEACEVYTNSANGKAGRIIDFSPREGAAFSFLNLAILGRNGSPDEPLEISDQVRVRMRYHIARPLSGIVVGIDVRRDGVRLLNSFDTDESPENFAKREPGYYESILDLPNYLLAAGRYSVSVHASMPATENFDGHQEVLTFDLEENAEDLGMKSYAKARGTMLIARLKWQTSPAN